MIILSLTLLKMDVKKKLLSFLELVVDYNFSMKQSCGQHQFKPMSHMEHVTASID